MTNQAIPAQLPVYNPLSLDIERGEGAYLIARDGRRYLDFMSGIAVTCLGHCHPHLVATLKAQADRLWHVSNILTIDEQKRLAERLVANSFAETVFVANSGAEALECAIKMTRRYHWANGQPERQRIITVDGAFHGRTLATIAAGGKPQYTEGFAPNMPGFTQIKACDYDALRAAIGPDTAGILVEPIQGEGGIRVMCPAFLADLRRLCDAHGLLLIYDEVQTGIGRTGRLFAYEDDGIAPDIMALAKGLGGGFPVGACVATAQAASGMKPGTHGSTFGGNPLACAVANAVLDVLLAPGFLDTVRARSEALTAGLHELADRYPEVISEVRGRGLLLGVRVKPTNTDVIAALRGHGLITVGAGDNVVRFLPPLIIEHQHVQAALDAFDATCRDLTARAA